MRHEPQRRSYRHICNRESSTYTIASDGLCEFGFCTCREVSHRHSSYRDECKPAATIFDSNAYIQHFTIDHFTPTHISNINRPETELPSKPCYSSCPRATSNILNQNLFKTPEFPSMCSMKFIDSSLGMFFLPPAEFRTIKWKHLSPQLHVGRSLLRKPNHLSRDQEILRTNRQTYAEVAAEVPSSYSDKHDPHICRRRISIQIVDQSKKH